MLSMAASCCMSGLHVQVDHRYQLNVRVESGES